MEKSGFAVKRAADRLAHPLVARWTAQVDTAGPRSGC